MSTYIEPDLLESPLNGLASSSEILNDQYRVMVDRKTISSTELDVDDFKAQPYSISGSEKELYDLRQTIEDDGVMQDAVSLLQPKTETNKNKYYDGPGRTGENIKTVATRWGLPTSWSESMQEAEDVVLGIPRDLSVSRDTKTSVADILTKDNRLRGIALLLICIAITGFIVKILAGT